MKYTQCSLSYYTMIDIDKSNLYEPARHNMIKIMSGAKPNDKLLFKFKEAFYAPSGGPKRYRQHAAAGGWKPQNYKPRFNFNPDKAKGDQTRYGGGTMKGQVDTKRNPLKNVKVMLCHVFGAYTHLRASYPSNPAFYLEMGELGD